MDVEYKKYKDTHLVYNDGRVYSLISNKFLKFDYSNSGYARLKLNGKNVRVHRLVMELFKGKSKARKEQSIDILKSYNIVPDNDINDDQADAFCILLYVESQENK